MTTAARMKALPVLFVVIAILIVSNSTAIIVSNSTAISQERFWEEYITLNWTAPQTNEDGSPLIDLGGYKVYYGSISRNYDTVIDVGIESVVTISNLVPHKRYFFAVTAYDLNNNESGFSAELVWAFDDTDIDGMSDVWETNFFGDANAPTGGAQEDVDGDGFSNLEEYVIGTDPTNGSSSLQTQIIPTADGVQVSSSLLPAAEGVEYAGLDRFVSLESCQDLSGGIWMPVQGMEALQATGEPISLVNSLGPNFAYRFRVWLE